jgi:hypothetical protein
MGKNGALHNADRTGEPFYDFYKGWRGKTPENAIRLAIADHQAAPNNSGMGNIDYVQQLQIAERQCKAYPDLLAALEAMLLHEGETTVNGIGLECESPALEDARNSAIAVINKAKGA